MTSPAVPQTNKLVPYTPGGSPEVDGITILYLKKEFAAIQRSLKSQQQIMVQLEARLKAIGA